jgi:hypothetical protein
MLSLCLPSISAVGWRVQSLQFAYLTPILVMATEKVIWETDSKHRGSWFWRCGFAGYMTLESIWIKHHKHWSDLARRMH